MGENTGTLYLVSTPIGNLSDFSPRGIETLKSVDLIAAEDTRNTLKLLNHFDIHVPLTPYHEFNRFEKAEELISELQKGKSIACVTDAGTPGISDPGEVLVRRCHEENIAVVGIPGPAAFVDALVISGLPTRAFSFFGFLPSKKKERNEFLNGKKDATETLIFYEAPHHLKKTLEDLKAAFGDREMALCRELTKVHEEVLRGTLSEMISRFETIEPKGEFVLILHGKNPEELIAEEKEKFENLSIQDHVKKYEAQGMDRKEAMRMVAKDRHISKKEVYDTCIGKRQN